MSNKFQKPIIRIFGVAGHGKGEVDHVGGTAKVAVRREIAAGQTFLDSEDIVEFLDKKFENSSTNYVFREIKSRDLDIEWAEAGRFAYPTINGSSKFHTMVFIPNSETFSASNIKQSLVTIR